MIRARSLAACILFCISLVAAVGCGRITPSRRSLRNAVEAKRDQLNQCYADTITRDANAAGGMALWLEVDSDNGRVSSVEVESSEVADQALGQCVQGALQSIQLEEPPPLAMRVHYHFQFQSDGAAPAPSAPPPPAVQGGDQQPPPPAQGM